MTPTQVDRQTHDPLPSRSEQERFIQAFLDSDENRQLFTERCKRALDSYGAPIEAGQFGYHEVTRFAEPAQNVRVKTSESPLFKQRVCNLIGRGVRLLVVLVVMMVIFVESMRAENVPYAKNIEAYIFGDNVSVKLSKYVRKNLIINVQSNLSIEKIRNHILFALNTNLGRKDIVFTNEIHNFDYSIVYQKNYGSIIVKLYNKDKLLEDRNLQFLRKSTRNKIVKFGDGFFDRASKEQNLIPKIQNGICSSYIFTDKNYYEHARAYFAIEINKDANTCFTRLILNFLGFYNLAINLSLLEEIHEELNILGKSEITPGMSHDEFRKILSRLRSR